MESIKEGDEFSFHVYKHNGKIYNISEGSIVLDIKEDYIVLGNDKATITEEDGRQWQTKEPAIIYFYKNKWYNIIGQIKRKGIFYYCNIATPYIIEDRVIKYIDYDLDLRVFPNYDYRVLDQEEYQYHSNKMEYPPEIDKILRQELDNLIEFSKTKKGPFNKEEIREYYKLYKEIKKNNKKGE